MANEGRGRIHLELAVALVAYVGVLSVIGVLLAHSDGTGDVLLLLLAATAASFLFGVRVARFEAVAIPAAACFLLFVVMLPPANDYSWADAGMDVFYGLLVLTGCVFAVIGGATLLGVIVGRAILRTRCTGRAGQ